MAWPIKLKANDILLREGEESLSMYLVQEGKLRITRMEGDKEILLGHAHAGEIVGELSFLDHARRSATVCAETDCLLFQVPSETMEKVLKANPPWLETFIKTLATRIRKADARIKV